MRHSRYRSRALFSLFAKRVVTALKDRPVVMVTGPGQCGKTTLVRNLVASNREFVTMDDGTVLAAARSDPTGLVRALNPSLAVPAPEDWIRPDLDKA